MTKPNHNLTQAGLVDEPGPVAKKFAGRVTTNKANARRYIEKMLWAYEHRWGRFKFIHHTTHGPQHIYVPGPAKVSAEQPTLLDESHSVRTRKPAPQIEVGSPEHLEYLFLVTPTDHMQKSDVLYAKHLKLYADHPWIYGKKVLRLTKEQLARLFDAYGIGLPNENARFFVNNAHTLYDEFGGNPVEIFRAAGATVEGTLAWREDYEKKYKRNPLLGYEHKIASLYLLYLAELGALPFPKDAFAVDVHVIFQMYQVGAFILHERMDNTQLAQVIREMICEISEEQGYDKIAMANAIWLNGSNGCNRCSENAAAELLCPVWSMCKGRYATDNYHHNGSIDPADPLFPKGGEWPKYGVLRMTRKRPEIKGRGKMIIEHIPTMFDEEFAEEEQKMQKPRKVIPITSAKRSR